MTVEKKLLDNGKVQVTTTEEQDRYESARANQPSQYTDLICDIRQIPSVELIESVIKKNNTMQLKRIKKNTSAMKRSMLFITIMRAYDNYVEDLKTILEAIKEAIETAASYKNVTL